MGSDRKSKDERKKNKKRASYSSASEDEGRRKRHRSEEKKERKSRRNDEKEKKSHKHRSDKEKKPKDKHKSKHHTGKDLVKSGIQIEKLSGDDYFSKNNEFATWLKEEKNIFFSDLSSESAREFFSNFVKAWNNFKLGIKYYEGISTGPRTAHNWKIKQ